MRFSLSFLIGHTNIVIQILVVNVNKHEVNLKFLHGGVNFYCNVNV